ncbi:MULTISPECIES: alpha/beta fold hydrolase [Ramlibacter]|uniref:Alpha/beta fold hydrolase n=1 Tax=Ramlibacter pinisoli TaxID=2682844 RepID=A0A6N8IWE1_9BURK|nr:MULTISPECIES: alpha/beta hydrolase [Ramlibacter]MBA2965454.1 alpha/beta hydrolase [Ramlibacter sp. CGMCC 1.13660]MVQ30420.1 alpha/beta fold hydrolase [Ramlibacter pinisoli]
MDLLQPLRTVDAGVLSVAYHEAGPVDGPAVVLLHGFPYDIHAYAQVVPPLVQAGCRVVVPYLRGYGATRFLHADTPRSGEQAALGADLLALLDALAVPRAVLAGYDWGGRACCVVAALWPQRCAGLVSLNSYNIFDHARALEPDTPENERRLWYQYYFHSERGREGLRRDRRGIARLLWQTWSPTWAFDDATFERSAAAFDHPDFVDVVIHSYRHRYNLVAGDPAYAEIERRLAALPPIGVPAITFDGADDGVRPPAPAAAQALRFSGRREHRVVPGVGHNLPQEAPGAFAQAVLELVRSG